VRSVLMATGESGEGSSSHGNPLFDETGPLEDALERRTIFAALDSF
jgi:hypothetical protein